MRDSSFFYPWCNTGHDRQHCAVRCLRTTDGHDPFKVIVDKTSGDWQAEVDADF
jgi:hypothetical protein